MNDFMNSGELKKYLDIINEGHRRFNDLLVPLVEKLCYDNSRVVEIKPTLSEILTEGKKRIDDAVEAVIARHEKEIADIKAKAEKEPACNDSYYSGYFGRSQYIDQQLGWNQNQETIMKMAQDRKRYLNQIGLAQTQGQYDLLQQMGSAQRDAMNQAQDQFGRWI
jgi:hypothetical protein